ncbi:CHAT domain-containing protein [Gloeopeniophorella convolvens]|nr:CHAT domain-containing protein [Gloeopeniophorella convolvens]
MDGGSCNTIRVPFFVLCTSPIQISRIPLSEQVRFQAYSEWMGTLLHLQRDSKPVDNDWFADGEKLLSTLPRKHILLSYILNAMFANARTDVLLEPSYDVVLLLIEQVILPCCTRAILLPFTMENPELESPFIISAFFCLSDALGRRFYRTHRLSDLDAALTYYRHLQRIRIPEPVWVARSRLSRDFAILVQWKIRLDPANEGAHLDELVTLSSSFLPSPSIDARIDADLVDFLEISTLRICQAWRHDELSRSAERFASHIRVFLGVCQLAYRPRLSIMLALMLTELRLPNHAGRAEIAALVEDSFPLLPSSSALRSFASDRFNDLLSGASLDAEEAELLRYRVSLEVKRSQDIFRTEYLRRMTGVLLRRHEEFGDESGLEEAQRCLEELHRMSEPGLGSTPSELRLEDLATSKVFEMSLTTTGALSKDPIPDLGVYRGNLEQIELGFEALIQSATLDEWIRFRHSLCESISALGSWGGIEDLDLCIRFLKTIHDALPRGHRFIRDNPRLSQNLLAALFHRRFLLLRRREDLEECLSMYEASCKGHRPGDAWRLGNLDGWAQLARQNSHPFALRAYESAMLAMQRVVEWGPDLQAQRAYFKRGKAVGTRTSLDYASYQIEKNQLQGAVEILEHGRSLLWSMMRGLRAPVGQLRAVNPDLADKYLCITHDLESITTESSALRQDSSFVTGSSRNPIRTIEEDVFGRVFEAQRRLLRERKAIISRIRQLPGFEHFLAAAPFHSLQNAASSGPIVVVNHSRWRSDILIIVHDAPLTHIRLGDDFYQRANALSSSLSKARSSEDGLDSDEYEQALRFVLHELYLLIGRQVIDRLDTLDPETDSRERYSSDEYVCSYTPTLAQPNDPSLMDVSKEIASIESVPGMLVSKLASNEATRESVIERLKGHKMVHFACHGLLVEDKPFDASFKLHGSDRLTLLDIIRSQLPDAELAFLSACHTAELADTKEPDEMLHLAAAMQYCGFRSVVGTMWEMADKDGKDMAKHFYRRLLSPRWDASVSIAERSAKALQFAVQKLRLKRGMTTERWVNFVHYGA